MNLASYRSGLERGAPRWVEALWWFFKVMFFLAPIPWPSAWRVAILRAFGARIGEGVVIRHGADISFPWRFQCGSHVWLGEGSRYLSLAKIEIGSHVCISQEAFLCSGSHDYRSPGFDLLTKPVHLSDECWVGARAFIGPGVRMGRGSVAGACSVITGDIPEGHLAIGNPAKNRPISTANP